MNKTSVVSARIRPDVKARTEKILKKLGLSTTDAITLLFNQIDLRNGLPFPVEIPNEVTRQAIIDTMNNTDVQMSHDMEEFKKAMAE